MRDASKLKILRSTSQAATWRAKAGGPVVLVPTMGALHAGHGALLDRARRFAGPSGRVVASIFVNPTQFGPKEDYTRYPRTLAADRRLCAFHGVDAIFHPGTKAMYPEGYSTFVEETSASAGLCGASRPGHFRGVCTVVLKLFHILHPDVAVFGLKDFQQSVVIRRMVRDLNLPVRIAMVETVREADGLALSSRNRYLTPAERAQAPVIRAALLAARRAFRCGESSAARLRALVRRKIASAPLARIDYVEIADAGSLQAVTEARRNCVIAVAVFFGKTRLIDNVWLR